MFSFLLKVFGGAWLRVKLWAIGITAVLAFIGGVYLKGKAAGKQTIREKNRKDLEKNVKEYKKMGDDLDSLSDDELRKRLSDDWELPGK